MKYTNTWTCVHCGLVKDESSLHWGTDATGAERAFPWRPECKTCRPNKSLMPDVYFLSSSSNFRRPGTASSTLPPPSRLGTPAAAVRGSTASPRLATPRSPTRAASPMMPRVQPPRSAPDALGGALHRPLSGTSPPSPSQRAGAATARPTTAAAALTGGVSSSARSAEIYAQRSQLNSRTVRRAPLASARVAQGGHVANRNALYGPFCSDTTPPQHKERSLLSSPRTPPPRSGKISSRLPSPRQRKRQQLVPAKSMSSPYPKLDRESLRVLLQETSMTRTELYRLFNRFKALCLLSGTPGFINKEMFKDGVSSLAFEDDHFVDRVFEILDENNNGSIEWPEFVNAVNALETGSAYDKLAFCFRVYDRDHDGSIERDELLEMFTAMLLRSGKAKGPPTPALQELIDDFVDTIYDTFDIDRNGALEFDEVLEAMNKRTDIADVWEIFGRTLVSRI